MHDNAAQTRVMHDNTEILMMPIFCSVTFQNHQKVIGIMLGAFFFAYIIGSFSSILHNLAIERDAYESKMRLVGHLLEYRSSIYLLLKSAFVRERIRS